jgi:hypothetical protein
VVDGSSWGTPTAFDAQENEDYPLFPSKERLIRIALSLIRGFAPEVDLKKKTPRRGASSGCIY